MGTHPTRRLAAHAASEDKSEVSDKQAWRASEEELRRGKWKVRGSGL